MIARVMPQTSAVEWVDASVTEVRRSEGQEPDHADPEWLKTSPLGIGGLSYGFTFGGSETHFRGVVSHIRGPSNVSGVYAAGNVGAAVGRGAQAIVLINPNGAELRLTGNSVGAIVSADLNGLVITVK